MVCPHYMELKLYKRRLVESRLILIYLLLTLIAVLFPVILWVTDSPFLSNTYGKNYELFELFGLTASIALITAAYARARQAHFVATVKLLPDFLFFFTAFTLLIQFVEYSFQSWDYRCYENAARILIQGGNIYTDSPEQCYLYPPLLAQGLAGMRQLIGLIGKQPAAVVWHLVFYLYQCSQFVAVMIAYLLSLRLARKLGLSITSSSLLVTALFLLNNPLVRTIRHNQVNIYMLDLVLLAMLLLSRYPILSGIAVAISAHLKLFSLVFLPIWLYMKQWRAIASTLGSIILILFIQTRLGSDISSWQQFSSFYADQPLQRFLRYRNNSLHSIVQGTLRATGLLPGLPTSTLQSISTTITAICTIALLIYLFVRFMRREALHLNAFSRPTGQSMDAFVFVLAAAPITWEHHYVLAIPLVIWAAARYGRSQPIQVGLSAFLMFGLPTFDVFPLSYHRLAGLLWWLYLTHPRNVPPIMATHNLGTSTVKRHLSQPE